MSVVTVSGLSLSYGKKTLFDDESFAIGPHDRIGLVGANGTGKSSLIKILAGVVKADSADIRFARKAKAGYLPQDIAGLPAGNLIDSVLSSVPGREELDQRLKALEEALPKLEGDDQMECAQELADVLESIEHFDDHYGRHHAERILLGLGFRPEQFEKPASTLSGGWRMRAALASLLLQDPELLLLDEPTNHLDVPTLTWFDGFLKKSRKAMVLISHDRDFLNRQINRVLSLEVEGLRSYTGNYDQYKKLRAAEAELLHAASEKQAARRAELEEFINRFGAKASKAAAAKSKQKLLDKMDEVTLLEERAKVNFRFPEVDRSGREVVTLKNIHKAYGNHVIYRGLSATVERGARIAVVGANGAGKTTLLKLVAGEITADSGESFLGHNVSLGYYAQHHAEKLDHKSTILAEIMRLVPDKPQSHVRAILGAFLFTGDDVEKQIGVLSGGERARVALAKLLLIPSNLLLMDEPTNHLDLDSSEMLIEALKSYSGTLMFVSHNRSFVNQLANQVWDVRDGGVVVHPGNLDDYLHHEGLQAEKAEKAASQVVSAAAAADRSGLPEKERKRLEAEARQKRSSVEGPLRKEISRLEGQISALETKLAEDEAALADPALYNDFAKAKPLMDAHRGRKGELEALYAKWEDASSRLAEALR